MSKRLDDVPPEVADLVGRQSAAIARWRLACLALAILAVAAVAWAAKPRYGIAANGPFVFVVNTATGAVERVPAIEITQRQP